jgi:protein-S-isoprenylcysteine O-methyltransferase Ste14
MSVGTIGIDGVMIAWCGFAMLLLFNRWSRRGPSQTRASIAWLGTLLQAIALGLFWFVRRMPSGVPLAPAHLTVSLLAVLVAVVLAWMGVALMVWAIRTLGRQWAVSARLVEGHELVTSGPYAIVRNSVYTGFFALALATGLAFAQPWALAAGVPIFWAGTVIRVRAEERLLHARFGSRYEAFRRRVPALVPWRPSPPESQ